MWVSQAKIQASVRLYSVLEARRQSVSFFQLLEAAQVLYFRQPFSNLATLMSLTIYPVMSPSDKSCKSSQFCFFKRLFIDERENAHSRV